MSAEMTVTEKLSSKIPTLTDVVHLSTTANQRPYVAPPDLSSLSKRERQVLDLLAQGYGVNEIGRMLCKSPKTISTYKVRVKQKLSIETNVQWMSLFKAMPRAAA